MPYNLTWIEQNNKKVVCGNKACTWFTVVDKDSPLEDASEECLAQGQCTYQADDPRWTGTRYISENGETVPVAPQPIASEPYVTPQPRPEPTPEPKPEPEIVEAEPEAPAEEPSLWDSFLNWLREYGFIK